MTMDINSDTIVKLILTGENRPSFFLLFILICQRCQNPAMSVELESAIGFSGAVPRGLSVHPAREHIVYPLGEMILV